MFLDFNFSKVFVWPIRPCLTLFKFLLKLSNLVSYYFTFSKVLVWPIRPYLTLFPLKTQAVKFAKDYFYCSKVLVWPPSLTPATLRQPLTFLLSMTLTGRFDLFLNLFLYLRSLVNHKIQSLLVFISSLAISWISSPRSKSTAGKRLGWTCYSLDSRWPRWVEHVDHIWPRWPSCTFWSCWQNWLRSHQVGLWLTVDGLVDQAKSYHSQGQHLRQA